MLIVLDNCRLPNQDLVVTGMIMEMVEVMTGIMGTIETAMVISKFCLNDKKPLQFLSGFYYFCTVNFSTSLSVTRLFIFGIYNVILCHVNFCKLIFCQLNFLFRDKLTHGFFISNSFRFCESSDTPTVFKKVMGSN